MRKEGRGRQGGLKSWGRQVLAPLAVGCLKEPSLGGEGGTPTSAR